MKISLQNTVAPIENIKKTLAPLRNGGKTLVTTNGCFDLLHSGHVEYLCDAAMQGDLLVVGINSDKSVAGLKGPSRPVQKENDRATIVAALKPVDYVFIFNEPDPCAFLDLLQPDVHVKGGDYVAEQLPEGKMVEKYGGRIVIVPFVQGHSTSQLINRIRSV